MNTYHKEFEYYFLQCFLSKRIKVDIKEPEKQDYFYNLSKSFQLSGYLLNSIDFSENSIDLKEKLIKLNNNYIKKMLLMRYEIIRISKLFNANKIEYVVLKGMAMKIKKIDSYRQFRDLDILISEKDLKKAYELLKTYGYAYFNNHANDEVKYMRGKHHLPPMVNNFGITIELHIRITKSCIFKSCPLTDEAFLEKEKHAGINVVSEKVLLAHTLYHGILQNELMSGPIFLLDIKNLLIRNRHIDNSIAHLLEKLKLNTEYKKVKLIIENCANKTHIDDILYNKFSSFFNESNIFPNEIDYQNKKKFIIKRLLPSIKFNSYYYQLPYWSPKLIFIMVKKLYEKLLV